MGGLLLTCESIFKTIPVIRFDLFNGENSFLVNTNFIREILTVFKNHFLYQFKMLTCISGIAETILPLYTRATLASPNPTFLGYNYHLYNVIVTGHAFYGIFL